jgi:hypothetical protein
MISAWVCQCGAAQTATRTAIGFSIGVFIPCRFQEGSTYSQHVRQIGLTLIGHDRAFSLERICQRSSRVSVATEDLCVE